MVEEIIVEVECVKIIGRIKGVVSEPIELIMDEQTFFEWKDKIWKKKK